MDVCLVVDDEHFHSFRRSGVASSEFGKCEASKRSLYAKRVGMRQTALARVHVSYRGFFPRTAPAIAEITRSTKNTKNSTLAMPAAVPATPVKPSSPAMTATIKNVIVQDSIVSVGFNDCYEVGSKNSICGYRANSFKAEPTGSVSTSGEFNSANCTFLKAKCIRKSTQFAKRQPPGLEYRWLGSVAGRQVSFAGGGVFALLGMFDATTCGEQLSSFQLGRNLIPFKRLKVIGLTTTKPAKRLLGSVSISSDSTEGKLSTLNGTWEPNLPKIRGQSAAFLRLVKVFVEQLEASRLGGLLAFWETNGKFGVCVYESSFWKPLPKGDDSPDWLPDRESLLEMCNPSDYQVEVRFGDGGGYRVGVWADLEDSFEESKDLLRDDEPFLSDLAWALEGMALRSPLLSIDEFRNARKFRGLDLAGDLVPILDNLPLCIAVYDSNGKPRYMNGVARTLLSSEAGGGTRIDCEELVSRTLVTGEVYSPPGNEGVMQVKIRKEDRFFRPYATPLVTQGGESSGVLLALSDVSDLRLANDLRGNFVGSVSHEIKGPLTSIRMAVMLLLDDSIGNLNTQQLDLAETAREEVERLLRTLHNFLDVQRLQGGQYQLDCTRIDARDLLSASVSEMKRVAKPRRVTLRIEENDTLDLSVVADKERVVHVLNIFVSNAIKHSEDRSVVTLSVSPVGESRLRFAVRDTGSGIDPRYHQQIFNSYVRTPGESTAGVGLGLSLAREFVQAHDGQVGLDSAIGEGSTFYFDIDRME